jgi:hypothetical protein
MKQTLFAALLFVAVSCGKQANHALPAGTASDAAAATKTGPLSVVYIEVNTDNLLNPGCYTLSTGGAQFFDMVVIFAANINYSATLNKAVLYNNSNVENVLVNYKTYIQPLQAKGIKVLYSILGNHTGDGIANFTSRAAAKDFATQVADTVNAYGLDGVDFDDEYAEYGEHGSLPPANDSSFVLLLSELRKQLPTKLLTLYAIGPAYTGTVSYQGQSMGSLLNYSWNPYYGTFSAPSISGMSKSQLSPAAVDFGSTSSGTSTSFAKQTVSGGYGVMMFYGLTSTSETSYLSGTSKALYGSGVTVPSGCLQP